MKVGELIKALLKFSDDLDVHVEDQSEMGANIIDVITVKGDNGDEAVIVVDVSF